MAIKYMNDVQINQYTPSRAIDAYDYSDELTSASNGDTVIIPATITGITVTLEIDTGNGKVQASTTPVNEILADENNAVWVDWDSGTVTVNTQDRVSPVSAIRQVNGAGTTKLTLRAQ